ncbi:M15 family metallopeptidase [Sutcliffiella cohnii]|uniref:M15 family metallopeptidase n=1 Tax=Sutcliffiella cohnii TaxID=33932 RepID=UPI002E1B7D70|nr:M15 family metallopeptidase [Sutcliffiella cohnii]
MKWKIASVVSVLLLSGCSLPTDFDWKFWEDKQIVENNNTPEISEIVEEQPEENNNNQSEIIEDIVEADSPIMKEEFVSIVKDGIIQNPTNLLVLVNKDIALPEDYVPDDLVSPNVPFIFDGEHDKRYIREEAARALETLFESASSEDVELFAVSGYRAYDTQNAIYNSYLKRWGEERTNAVSAVPGHSEHQTGLAMDVTSRSVELQLTEDFGETVEGIWLQENAHKFGFIIRYPLGKETITGYQYEPWHLRYVGEEVATHLWKEELTLEEFFGHESYQ